jgi:LysM repeat protein
LLAKLFWGRGKLLRFTAQFLGTILLLFTFVSYTYKTATFDSAEHNFQNVYAAQQDLLIQGASTNTQIPKDRNRMHSEQYVVKVGDTLSSVAEYYGLDTDTILWANDLN